MNSLVRRWRVQSEADRPASVAGSADAAPRGAVRLPRFHLAGVARLVSHLAVWTPFAYALIRGLQQGWRPVSDNAVIGLNAWDVLGTHGPLVGQATRLAQGVFDPGPLEFWLLALPVHLDPAHGVLWGGTLWCAVAGSLAIEAAASAGGRLGAVIASGMILGFVAWIPQIATLPAWNPWFGGMFFMTALAACWAVMAGRAQWWPVLAVAGSVAAQAHLMFAIPSALLMLAGFLAVLTDSLRSGKYRWAVIGVAAGLACWTAPLIQQFTSRSGNLAALIGTLHAGGGSRAGISFGLKALSAATQPPAYWWQSSLPHLNLGVIGGRAAWFGIAQLAVTALILLVAIVVLRSRWAAALAALSLLADIALLETYSGIPKSSLSVTPSTFNDLTYLMAPMFAVGVLAWLAAATVLVLLCRDAAQRSRTPIVRPQSSDGQTRAARGIAARWGMPAAALVAVALILLTSRAALQIGRTPELRKFAMNAVSSASLSIEHEISPQRVVLAVVSPNGHYRREVTFGIAYVLRTAGYSPEIMRSYWTFPAGSPYHYAGTRLTRVTVYVRPDAKTQVTVSGRGRIRRP